MKVLFKNTTKYDKENCNNFMDFHTNKYGKKELIKYILMFIGFLYILIFNIIYKNWYFILAVLLLGILIYSIFKVKKRIFKILLLIPTLLVGLQVISILGLILLIFLQSIL